MGAVQKVECAEIRVGSPEKSIEFYTEVMGLVEMERSDGTTYLGCGMDTRYDLAVREGPPGLDRFGMRVTDEEFEQYAESLRSNSVETYERTGPGHQRGLYFDLPVSGSTIGLVVVEDTRYQHSAEASGFMASTAPVAPDRLAIAPTDIDHVALVSPDIEREARFLEKVIGFRVSDAKVTKGEWDNAFIRFGLHHHDISLFSGAAENKLDHVAWAANDLGHMQLFADKLAQHAYQLSQPITKHGPGANVAMYFYEPGTHRFELNTGMATVEPDAPEGIYEAETRKGGKSLWGGH